MIEGYINPTKVLCREQAKEERKTQSGIFIPAVGKDPQITATVVQVGSGIASFPMEVRVGERVLFYPHAAQRFNLGDEPMLLVDARDILFRYVPEL
jgi:co-chaperonin GroES (HSP10)